MTSTPETASLRAGAARLDHVRLDVRDMDTTERFYTEVLGLRRIVRYEPPDVIIMQMGPGGAPPGVELWQTKGLTPSPSASEHVAFAVGSVVPVVVRARAFGSEVVQDPTVIGSETVAFVRDPDGHLVELNDFRGRGAGS